MRNYRRVRNRLLCHRPLRQVFALTPAGSIRCYGVPFAASKIARTHGSQSAGSASGESSANVCRNAINASSRDTPLLRTASIKSVISASDRPQWFRQKAKSGFATLSHRISHQLAAVNANAPTAIIIHWARRCIRSTAGIIRHRPGNDQHGFKRVLIRSSNP